MAKFPKDGGVSGKDLTKATGGPPFGTQDKKGITPLKNHPMAKPQHPTSQMGKSGFVKKGS